MTSPKIDIGLVNFNCNLFILKHSINSILKKTKYLNKLIICDNGSEESNINFLKSLRKLKKIKIIFRKQSVANASIAKGEGLNEVIKFFKSEYAAFIENDGYMIMKNWDEYLINFLKKKNLDIIGNEHPLRNKKKINECFTTFSVFKTKPIFDKKINFLPDGKSDNYLPGKDTGFEMIKKLQETQADVLILKSGRKRESKYFNFDGFAEYHYEGTPIFAHFGRGSSHSEILKKSNNIIIDIIKFLKRIFTSDLIFSNANNIIETKIKIFYWKIFIKKDLLK